MLPHPRIGPDTGEQAKIELKNAEEDLKRTQQRGQEVRQVTNDLRNHREADGFTRAITEAMRRI